MVLILTVTTTGALRGTTCFRPLAGIMVLIGYGRYKRRFRLTYVSVPLRGLWFLST